MPDPVSLFVSIGAQLKTATDIAIGFSKLKTMAEVNAKAIDLQGAILGLQSDAFAAQAQQSAMIQRIRDLEKELARVEAWEETKQRYQLVTPWAGATVYALKREGGTTEPAHWICTKCYEDRRKSILNARAGDGGFWIMYCPICKSEVHSRYSGPSNAKFAEDCGQEQPPAA